MAAMDKYRISSQLGEGGFARVFRATRADAPQEGEVALKVGRPPEEERDARPRMRREIEVQSRFAHPNIMPILDSNADEAWFTMPLALGSLEDMLTDGRLKMGGTAAIEIVEAVAAGLEMAHEAGCVHRDITPSNILALPDTAAVGGRRWVVADWGIVRRPRGATTVPRTERGGGHLGTWGYRAPELQGDAHEATAAADVFSLARVAARIVTGEPPVATPSGPWGSWVRACTSNQVSLRPPTTNAARQLLEALLQPSEGGIRTKLRGALQSAKEGSVEETTWEIIAAHREDPHVLELAVRFPIRAVRSWVAAKPDSAVATSHEVCAYIADGWGSGGFERYDAPLRWVLAVMQQLARVGDKERLEGIAFAFFEAEAKADRWNVRDEVIKWLATAGPPSDEALALALHRHANPARLVPENGHIRSDRIASALGL